MNEWHQGMEDWRQRLEDWCQGLKDWRQGLEDWCQGLNYWHHVMTFCHQLYNKRSNFTIYYKPNLFVMKINFNRRKIERICIMISFVLVIILTTLGIFAIADGIFYWDLFPKGIEKVITLFMWASGVIIFATFLISLMVNLSLISSGVEKIAENTKPKDKE
jgi:hypothetical protein